MSIIRIRSSNASIERYDRNKFLDLPDTEVSWPFSDLVEQVSV